MGAESRGNGIHLLCITVSVRAAAGILLLSFVLPIASQTPTVIGVTSRLVEVGASVVDSHGQHVSGLTRQDFILLDQGRPQAITSFTDLQTALGSAAVNPPPAADAQGVWTNRPAGSPQARLPLTVFLLDRLNTGAQDQAAAQTALHRFLAEEPPGGAMALYLLSDGLFPLIELTYNRQAVLEAVNRHAAAENGVHILSSLPPSRTGLPIDWMENFSRSRVSAWYMPQRRVRLTVEALMTLAQRLGRVSGRKNLIWISGGCPQGVGPAGLLSAANVFVYPLDAHGVADLDVRLEDHISPLGYVDDNNEYHDGSEAARFPPDPGFLAKMGELAELTGGAALTGSNNLLAQLRKAVAYGRGDYLLGFRPDSARWDGTFHALRVKVNRDGLKVQARGGYLAEDALPDTVEQLRLAAENPDEATGVPLEVSATRSPAPDAATLITRVHVGGSAVAFEEGKGGGVARLKLVFVQFDAAGRAVGDFEQSLTVPLSGATLEVARRIGLRLTTPVSIQAGAQRLRVLLQDVTTGAVGSVSMPL